MDAKEMRKVSQALLGLVEAGGATKALVQQECGLSRPADVTNIINSLGAANIFIVEDTDKVLHKFDDEDKAEAFEAEVKAKTPKAAKKASYKVDAHIRLGKAANNHTTKLQSMNKALQSSTSTPKDIILKLKADMAKIAYTISALELKKCKQGIVDQYNLESVADLDAIDDLEAFVKEKKAEAAG